jgi:hypothetical protein
MTSGSGVIGTKLVDSFERLPGRTLSRARGIACRNLGGSCHSRVSNHQNPTCGPRTTLIDSAGAYRIRGGWCLTKIELNSACMPSTVSDVMMWDEVPDSIRREGIFRFGRARCPNFHQVVDRALHRNNTQVKIWLCARIRKSGQLAETSAFCPSWNFRS